MSMTGMQKIVDSFLAWSASGPIPSFPILLSSHPVSVILLHENRTLTALTNLREVLKKIKIRWIL